MARELYEKCWGCKGTRKLTVPVHIDMTRKTHRNAQVGEDCPLCTDGYCAIGMTVGQLERLLANVEDMEQDMTWLFNFDPTSRTMGRVQKTQTGNKSSVVASKVNHRYHPAQTSQLPD